MEAISGNGDKNRDGATVDKIHPTVPTVRGGISSSMNFRLLSNELRRAREEGNLGTAARHLRESDWILGCSADERRRKKRARKRSTVPRDTKRWVKAAVMKERTKAT